jgi:hypothetical protein
VCSSRSALGEVKKVSDFLETSKRPSLGMMWFSLHTLNARLDAVARYCKDFVLPGDNDKVEVAIAVAIAAHHDRRTKAIKTDFDAAKHVDAANKIKDNAVDAINTVIASIKENIMERFGLALDVGDSIDHRAAQLFDGAVAFLLDPATRVCTIPEDKMKQAQHLLRQAYDVAEAAAAFGSQAPGRAEASPRTKPVAHVDEPDDLYVQARYGSCVFLDFCAS